MRSPFSIGDRLFLSIANRMADQNQPAWFVYLLSSIRRSQPLLTCYYLVRRTTRPNRGLTMKRSVITALGAAVIAMLGGSSAAEAATIDFGVISVDGSITFTGGSSLDQSTVLDLDLSFLAVNEILPGDESGLDFFDPVSLTANTSPVSSQIIYTSGLGPLGAVVTLTWVASVGPGTGDTFTETLTTVAAINRAVTDEIGLELTGTVSDNMGLFFNAPILLNLTASESNGLIDVEFTNATTSVTPSVPEPSAWVMMALGFGALGYAGFRRRTAVLSA
jgi:hypothetical protein